VTLLATGIPDLDMVLGGGLEPGAVLVLAGPPGTGKTIMAQQICFATATEQHKAIYYTTLSEPHSKLVRHLQPFAFFEPEALGARVEHIHLGDLLRGAADGLEPMVSEVVRHALETQPAIIVIDSAKLLRDYVGETELREAFYDLTSRIAHTDAVLFLVGEWTLEEMESRVEFSLADGIVQLAYEPREPLDRRWLRVLKMRGSGHLEGKHTFRINPSGIEVFSRIETHGGTSTARLSGRISSGTPGLDDLMGGGLWAGDTTVVVGPSGVGKTIFGLRFVAEGLETGERCLYVTLQDTAEELIERARGFDWDLDAAYSSGQLIVAHMPVGDLDLDALATGVRQVLAAGPIQRVVIDSLAELVSASREAERFPAYARSLAGIIRAAGASLLVTSETTTIGVTAEPWEGLTFLFHNVLLLRYVEFASRVGRALNIIKMRNSRHDMTLYEFDIGEHGLTIGAQLEASSGTLGWSALRALDGTTSRWPSRDNPPSA
jgi:circadian clock protein KaiC